MAVFKPANSKNFHYRFMSAGRIRTGSCHTANKAHAVRYEALKKEDAYKKQFLDEPTDRDHITVKQAIEQYFNDNAHRTIPKTYSVCRHKTIGDLTNNRTGKKMRVACLKEDMHINEVRERDVQALITSRFKEGVSAATIIYELVFISQVIKHVKRLGYLVPTIDFAELKKANKLQPSKGRLRTITDEEHLRIVEQLNINLPTDTPITKMQRLSMLHFYLLSRNLGTRAGELRALKWADVDMEAKTISLYRPKVRNESVLGMSDVVYDVLQARLAVKAEEQIYVFEGMKGGPMVDGRQAFTSALERAGIKDVSFHTMRHTYASILVQNNVSLYAVQQMLGHTNASTTQKYAHFAPSQASVDAVQRSGRGYEALGRDSNDICSGPDYSTSCNCNRQGD